MTEEVAPSQEGTINHLAEAGDGIETTATTTATAGALHAAAYRAPPGLDQQQAGSLSNSAGQRAGWHTLTHVCIYIYSPRGVPTADPLVLDHLTALNVPTNRIVWPRCPLRRTGTYH